MKQIPERLRQYFESQGITQQNIADRFGVAKQSVNPYLLGHTNIKTTQIYAKILAKDVDAQFERLDGLFG